MNFISNLGYVAVCVAGCIFVARKKLDIGDVQAFILYIRMFTQPVAQAAAMINMLQSAVASGERIFEVLDAQEESSDASGAEACDECGDVSFENVSFGYSEDRKLFDNLSMVAKTGHTVAIVG